METVIVKYAGALWRLVGTFEPEEIGLTPESPSYPAFFEASEIYFLDPMAINLYDLLTYDVVTKLEELATAQLVGAP